MFQISGDEFAGTDMFSAGYDAIVGDERANQLAALMAAASGDYLVHGDYASAGALPAGFSKLNAAQLRNYGTRMDKANMALRAQVARLTQQLNAMHSTPLLPIRGGFSTAPLQNLQSAPVSQVGGYPLGFDSTTTIATTAIATVSSQPQTVFRCERLVIPASIAPSFLVVDVKIGNRSQLNNSTNIPASVFAENAVGVSLRWDTAQISQVISITVTNIAATTALRFVAAMLGTGAM